MSTLFDRRQELQFIGADLFLHLPDPHIVVDEHGLMRHVNEATCESFGYSLAELDNQHINLLIPSAKQASHQKFFEQYMADPKPRKMGIGLVIKARRKSGVEVPIEIELRPLPRSHVSQRRIVVRIRFTGELLP